MMKRLLLMIVLMASTAATWAVGASGMYQWSVQLVNYVSPETGKVPNAYLWIPQGCKRVKAAIVAQQNMTEETFFKMESFRQRLADMDIAIVWIAPAFTNNWDPATGCQAIFDEMMTGLAYQSNHIEIASCPVIPLGHSAQATFPWNFAAWNAQRTLCIVSFHGDAPRTNLCGYGTANVEWGRTRNIDGIPGLMVEGEYEWWEARVLPALAFRMMYPESCISFLADTGRGHFDCSPLTADYVATFIEKAIALRLTADGKLRKVDPTQGWLAERWHPGQTARAKAAPYNTYKGDRHDAFWYADEEMALLTESRYAEPKGRKPQYMGIEFNGKCVDYNEKLQGGMAIDFDATQQGEVITLRAFYSDSTHVAAATSHSTTKPRMEIISGAMVQTSDSTFRLQPYEAGMDNPRRSFTAWAVAVGDGDKHYKGAVQPIRINIKNYMTK